MDDKAYEVMQQMLALELHPEDYRAVRGDLAVVAPSMAYHVDNFAFTAAWLQYCERFKEAK